MVKVPWPSREHLAYVLLFCIIHILIGCFLSENCLIGAINAENDEANKVQSQLDGTWGGVPQVAAQYRDAGIKWVVVGDHNYGEGSSREHAALEPRFLGGLAIVVRSFARIHETNLKKQGMLALTFVNPEDYEVIKGTDKVDIKGLETFAPGKDLVLVAKHQDGSVDVRFFLFVGRAGIDFLDAGDPGCAYVQ